MTSFEKRWSRHVNCLNPDTHHSIKLQRAWNKYGSEAFVFEILEECELENCIKCEQHYLNIILHANQDDNIFDNYGLNINRVAGSRLGMRHSDEARIKMSNSRRGRYSGPRHPMYGKRHTKEARLKNRTSHAKLTVRDVKMIRRARRWGISQRQIAERFSVSRQTISDIDRGVCWGEI